MHITDYLTKEGPEISLAQNRLTVAGLALATLFFSANFSLNLHKSLNPNIASDYRIEFAYLEASLILGAIAGFLSIGSLLLSQQLSNPNAPWFASRRWWFAMSTIWLYLTLSQAFSAGLVELVFSIAQFSSSVGMLLSVVSLLVWWLLLFIGPIQLIRRYWTISTTSQERICLSVSYIVFVVFMLGTTAEIYRLHIGNQATIATYLKNFFFQIIQPLGWPFPW